jgi:hypothetical protein
MNRSLPPGIQRRNCGFVINILTGTSGLSSSFVSKKRHGLSFRIRATREPQLAAPSIHEGAVYAIGSESNRLFQRPGKSPNGVQEVR